MDRHTKKFWLCGEKYLHLPDSADDRLVGADDVRGSILEWRS